MVDIQWEDPPEKKTTKAHLVFEQLKSRPHTWAKIATEAGLAVLPWWGPIANHAEIEMRYVSTSNKPFGPQVIYARYVGYPE